MPRGKALSQETWELMVTEYRASGGSHVHVSRATGVKLNTCKKYWSAGGSTPWSKIPIKDVISAEQDELRAYRQRTRQDELEAEEKALGRLDAVMARADRIDQRVKELNLVGLLKANIVDVVAMQADLLIAADSIRADLTAALTSEEMKKQLKDNPRMALSIIRAITNLVSTSGDAVEQVIKLERLIVGQATDRHVHQFENVEQASAAIQRATLALERAGLQPRELVVNTTARSSTPKAN